MCNKYSYFIICLALAISSYGQYKNVDSLNIRLNVTTGKAKADVLIELARSLYKKDPTTAQKHLDELRVLSDELKYEKGLINSIQLSGRIQLNKKEYENALVKFRESKERAVNIKDTKLITESYWLMAALYSETGKLSELNALAEGAQLYNNTKDGMDAIARISKSKAIYYYSRSNYKIAKEEFLKANEIYKKLNDATNILGTGMNIGVLEFKTGNVKKSISTYEALIPEIKKIHDTLLYADCITNIALSEFELGNNSKSIQLQEEANKLYLQLNNNNRYQSGIMNMSSNLMKVGKADLALKYLLSSLDFARKKGDQNAVVLCYRNLGDLNMQNGDTTRGLEFFNEGLQLARKNKFPKEEGSFLRGLGQLETHRRHFELAFKYLSQSEAIYTSLNLTKEQESLNISFGNMYLRKKEYDKAVEYYTKTLESALKSGSKYTIAGMYSNLGVIFYEQHNYDKSIEYYSKALEIRKQINSPYEIADSYLTLSNSYYEKKDYEKSYDYYKSYHKLLDSLRNISSKKEMADMQTKYDTKEKEQEIEMLSKDKSLKTLLLEQNAKELLNQQLLNEGKVKEISLLNKDKIINENNLKAAKLAESEKQKELEIANKDRIINEKEAKRQKQVRYVFTGGFVLVLIFALFILRSYVQKRKANSIILSQKKEVEHQNELIQHQKKEITDSINYAQRIQQAILPHASDIKISDHFIMYKPKDIVSGDFYFYKRTQTGYIIAVADCTGHGVPGAFMSLIGSRELNEITKRVSEPGKILHQLNQSIKDTLKQNKEDSTRDGMDVAMIHVEGNKVLYSGANRPLWYVNKSNAILQEVKATKQAIGGLTNNDQEFEQHSFEFENGDMLYLSSDGFADQFGGEKGKKFTTKKLKDELTNIYSKPISEQHAYLNQLIENWRGNIEQLDDICVIGIRI
jgi:serine phosphatase RsbU (regulator of sigma subunit)